MGQSSVTEVDPARTCPSASSTRPHWNVTVLLPSGLVAMVDVIGCEPYFAQ
jgi:hypothetical protein